MVINGNWFVVDYRLLMGLMETNIDKSCDKKMINFIRQISLIIGY